MWQFFSIIYPTENWQFTSNTEARIFRLRHLNPPISPIGWIAQAEFLPDTDLYQFYDIRRINGLTSYECLELIKPIFFNNRLLAFRQNARLVNNWGIEIEAFGKQLTSFYNNPMLTDFEDNNTYELGLRFKSSIAGSILAIKYWKAAFDTTTHIGKLWSDSGSLLASVTFSQETQSGWQQQYLASPYPILAENYYRISVNATSGYAFKANDFDSEFTVNNLSAPIGAGCFSDGIGIFPNTNINNTNYYRDLIFRPNQ